MTGGGTKGPTLDRRFGREAFGLDPTGYDDARPAYPETLYAILREEAGLRPGARLLEIGAGTGTATRALLTHDPARLVAVEPDTRLAAWLRNSTPDPRLQVIEGAFEDVTLPPGDFDLACSATAFHWLDTAPALAKLFEALRPGGSVALFWNVFGDTGRPDPFHDATQSLFAQEIPSPSQGAPERLPYALDEESRLADLTAAGFKGSQAYFWRWTLPLDPLGVRALYSTYSNVNALPAADRERLLDGLAEIAERAFDGRVERNMTTALYVARRP